MSEADKKILQDLQNRLGEHINEKKRAVYDMGTTFVHDHDFDLHHYIDMLETLVNEIEFDEDILAGLYTLKI